MAVVAHFGTFDVENYGDLLFPAILERRLSELDHQFIHVSPHGGPPVWGDCVSTLSADVVINDPPDLAGVVVGGGHIIHASPSSLEHYDQGGLSSIVAYPSLWLGAASLAARRNTPYCWNAPGVPQEFSAPAARLVEWAASIADYLAVRDQTSRSRLIDAGVSRPIPVVPDTAVEVARLWSTEQLEAAFVEVFRSRGREVPNRVVAIHLNRRYAEEDLPSLAARLDRTAQRLQATPILIAIGPCHGDDHLQRDVGALMASAPVVIDRPQSLREVTACIARAEVYLGSSLHGMITACSFGTRGIVIVPRSAGTIGKFVGFLEPFQLTHWLVETWAETELRLDELVAAPRDPWARVLDAATPILDEHWNHVASVLGSRDKAQRRTPALSVFGSRTKARGNTPAFVDKQGALDRLRALSDSAITHATLYAPILVEQAIRANEHAKAANEERRQKDKAVASQHRLRAEVEAQRAAAEQVQRSLDALQHEREKQQTELVREQERLQTALAAERTQKEQALAGQERLRAEVAAQQATAQADRQAREDLLRERERVLEELTTDRGRLREELREERKHHQQNLEAQRAAVDQAQRVLEELGAALTEERRQKEQTLADELEFRTELTRERDRLLAEVDHIRHMLEAQAREDAARFSAESAAARRDKERVLTERDRLFGEVEELRTAVTGALLLGEETAEDLLDVGRRLGQVDALLARLTGRLSRKQNRLLESAQLELFRAREQLSSTRRDLKPALPEDIRGEMPIYDPNRVLPGRPTNGRTSSIDQSDSVEHRVVKSVSRIDPAIHGNGTASTGIVDEVSYEAELVVCVHNAIDDVKCCLASVTRHTESRHRVIVVDDGSDAQCATYLREFADAHPHFTLLRNEEPLGYTQAANLGLRQTTAELVVLLNSDTIVTPFWLGRLIECARSDPKIGIVGPLSNAASYQSVPERFDPNGDWALNPVPPGWDIDQVSAAVAKVSSRVFPRVPFVNGFCFAIKRCVIDTIGVFDDEGFPDGYGEENDYCLRAADAGFALAIADHAYVHHAKSRSYSHERRRDLGKIGRSVLVRKHGTARLEAGEALLRNEPTLAKMRLALGAYLKAAKPAPSPVDATPAMPTVLFLLPVSGGGGGAHSVVQEATGMRRLGVEAQVAIRSKHLLQYRENYPAIGDAERLFFAYRTLDELMAHAAAFDVVVATIHTSMPLVAAITAERPSVVPAYYIQDYEPYFYPEGSPEREEAARSYTLVPNAVLFAKTRWLCDTVGALHGVQVHKVSPSIDHEVYFPPSAKVGDSRVRVAAMIRPSSPRRGAERTMEVLRRLAREFGHRVDVRIFGCTEAALDGAQLPIDFPFTNHGVLTREQVADLLRDTDLFLDLSDYQAFGRTGLEAMACGCAVVVPTLGGTGEYAVDRENALVVDTSRLDACFEAARELVVDRQLRGRLQEAGVAKTSEYSIDRAARSELEIIIEISSARQYLVDARSTATVVA